MMPDVPMPFGPPPTGFARYYVAPKETVAGHYGSSLEISIPEPDGELMLTVLDHNGHAVTDVYFDHDELNDAIVRVVRAYARIPEIVKNFPYKPPVNHPLVEGNHP
ncbi:MAG: hypothetical protein ACREMY_07315 [bacterium]